MARSLFLLTLPLFLFGCKPAPAPTPVPASTSVPAVVYPQRPTVSPATFKLFHHANNSFTLVAKENVSDDEIASLVWQLRDTARTHAFDTLHIAQKQVDADGPTVWFHIYRGTKCAAEKYAPGEPPCGGSYHAAGDYTFDTHTTPPWDKGVLLHDPDHPTMLWDPDAPYSPPAAK